LSEFILLRLTQTCLPHSWLRVDSNRGAIGSTQSAQLPLPEGLGIVAIYANAKLGLRALSFPKSAREKYRQAIAFALEDSVASDVEDLAFVTPKQLQEGSQIIAMIQSGELESLREKVQQISPHIKAIVPLAQLLPMDSVWIEKELSCYRFGTQDLGCIETESIGSVLKLRLNQDGTLPVQMLLAAGQAQPKLPAHIHAETLVDPNQYLATRLLATPQLLNLAESVSEQSLFARGQTGAGIPSRWRLAAGLAFAALCVQLGGLGLRYFQLQAQVNERELAIEKHYQSVFTNGPIALDPAGMLISKLKTEQQQSAAIASGGALGMLRKIAPVLYTETRLTLIRVDYRNAQMELSFRSPDLAGIDQLRARLSTIGGLNVNLGSNTIDPNGQMLTGRITIAEQIP
jgi:type II secretion system protein L